MPDPATEPAIVNSSSPHCSTPVQHLSGTRSQSQISNRPLLRFLAKCLITNVTLFIGHIILNIAIYI